MNLTFDFAFEGFRIIRERPKLIAFWGAITLFGYGVMSLIMVQVAGPELVAFNTMVVNSSTMAAPKFDQAYMAQMTQQILLAGVFCLPVYLLMTSVLVCAICRVSLGETNDRLGFLAFGVQEVRMIAVRAATLALLMGLFAGICVVGGIIGLLASGASPQAATGVQTLSVIVGFGTAAWLGLRLSLNGAQSFETRRMDILGSFAMTNERFWSLFTGYATAMALAVVVRFLCDKIIEAVQVLSLGLKVTGDMIMPDLTNLTTFLTPASVIALVLTFAFVAPLMAAIQLGAPVAAYRALRGKVKPQKVEEKAAG
ncbi:hypothetical protein [Asticcacaulis sp.]|uniref:hypothetical protein n=1 Tax=Asticcacaulis sp. TaxID=1872648 RepID=UPI002C363E55|nr:hypothetical protein [Asticcacaulis sp.]HTM83187.1 hypothetical protein [Asticcacaulis sp.]